jgi:hypothetical protein
VSEKQNQMSSLEVEDIEIEEISQDEAVEEIAREARERLDMSFDEFLENYQNDNLKDTLAVNELVILLRFAGFGRNGAAA